MGGPCNVTKDYCRLCSWHLSSCFKPLFLWLLVGACWQGTVPACLCIWGPQSVSSRGEAELADSRACWMCPTCSRAGPCWRRGRAGLVPQYRKRRREKLSCAGVGEGRQCQPTGAPRHSPASQPGGSGAGLHEPL